MTHRDARDVELVRHRCRGQCRPGAEVGSQSGTEVPRPLWDRGAELSHRIKGGWVDPTSHYANHRHRLQLGVPAASISWHDGRQALSNRELHRDRTKSRHQENPAFHGSALEGLSKGRERRAWSTDSILAAIDRFERQYGRWPIQKDFRSDNGLPGYATLWSRFGGIGPAVELVRRPRNEA